MRHVLLQNNDSPCEFTLLVYFADFYFTLFLFTFCFYRKFPTPSLCMSRVHLSPSNSKGMAQKYNKRKRKEKRNRIGDKRCDIVCWNDVSKVHSFKEHRKLVPSFFILSFSMYLVAVFMHITKKWIKNKFTYSVKDVKNLLFRSFFHLFFSLFTKQNIS